MADATPEEILARLGDLSPEQLAKVDVAVTRIEAEPTPEPPMTAAEVADSFDTLDARTQARVSKLVRRSQK